MVVLSKGLLLFLVWHVTGPNLFALSTLVDEAELAEDSINRPPAVLNDQNAFRLTLLDEEELDQHYPSEYGSIPQEQAKREAEIKSMENDHKEIKKRIKLLKAAPGQPSKAKSQLEELHKTLKIPMQERLRRLKLTPTQSSESGSSFNLVEDTSQLENTWHVLRTGLIRTVLRRLKLTPTRSSESSFNLVEDTSKLENSWNVLQTQLIRTVYRKKHMTPAEADFLLEFLKSFFLLGDSIYTYGLLPAPFIKKIQIFRAPTIFDMMGRHIDWMFRRNQGNFFDHAESVIPQLEFLQTAPSVNHFHRTLKALPAEYNMYVVYWALDSIVLHSKSHFATTTASEKYDAIRSEFVKVTFLNQAQHLLSELKKNPDLDYRLERESISTVALIGNIVNYFQKPPANTLSNQRRLEFQIVFYILDFLDMHCKPLVEAMVRRGDIRSPFQKQLEYMRGYLKFYQNQFHERAGSARVEQDMTFLELSKDGAIHDWIKIIPLDSFEHNMSLRRSPKFNLWMGQKV